MGVMTQTHQGIEAVMKKKGEIAMLSTSGRGGAVTFVSIVTGADYCVGEGVGPGLFR